MWWQAPYIWEDDIRISVVLSPCVGWEKSDPSFWTSVEEHEERKITTIHARILVLHP